MRDYRDKVVVVTGGAGGLGCALARRYGDAGARIALLDLEGPRLDEACEALRSSGLDVRAVPCDVTDAQACRVAFKNVSSHLGGVDVLINNAGIVHRSAVSKTDVAVIRKVMEVNFLGAVHCTKFALDDLLKLRGQVIVISSIAGLAPLLGRAGYSASKYALHGFFESMRTELQGTGVDVTMACPGFIDTGFDQRAVAGDGKPHSKSRSKVGGLASAADVAGAIFEGARRNRRLLVLSPIGRISYFLSRFWPAGFDRLMIRTLSKEIAST